MTRDALKRVVAELISESIAMHRMSVTAVGKATGLGGSVACYMRGVNLPSTGSWSKLMGILNDLPDLRPEIAQANFDEQQDNFKRIEKRRNTNEGSEVSVYNDITPQERDAVVKRVFGCHARQVPGYDDMSTWVLVKLKKTPLAELRQNRMQVLCKLFAEARHAVQQ